MNYKEKVYEVVRQIPSGKVATYGQIAAMVGLRNPRVVGNILHQNLDPVNVPCHRVVNREGGVAPAYAFGGVQVQRSKLEHEGVIFVNHKVDLEKCLWDGK